MTSILKFVNELFVFFRFIWGYDAMISYIRRLNLDFESFIRRNNEDNNGT